MIQLHGIQARVERLKELTQGLAKEVTTQKAAGGLLLPVERKQYLDGVQDALAGLDEARNVLAGVVKRLEERRA